MSCSEGETEAGGECGGGGGGGTGAGSTASPVVKYVIPAVFGGLTLLLAKRWATSPGTPTGYHPHSLTGVSRRRRILKDPPVRRAPPPPPQPPSSLSPPAAPVAGSSSSMPSHSHNYNRGAAKKSDSHRKTNSHSQASAEDDLNSNLTPEMAGLLTGPRHIPFPNIPQDGNLLFESMTFIFIVIATATQFLNIYRTVWWLPTSYNNQTMNFYLIDRHLVVFIIVVIGRRLIFSLSNLTVEVICPSKYLQFIHRVTKIVVLILILSVLGWCTYNLFQVNFLLNIFYLCYPIIIYLLLFRVDATPFLQLVTWGSRSPHCCASGAPGIRNEVELLKADFNSRLKQVIFSSVVGAYYSSYIPWCFAQSFVYFDIVRIVRHLFLVWVGLLTQHASQCLSAKYCDQLHRAALHLGKWDRPCDMTPGSLSLNNLTSGSNLNSNSQASNVPTGPIVPWCHKTLWSPGSAVKHGKSIYTVASTSTVAAEPGNDMHWRFYILFHNPSAMVCVILCIQISLVLFELFLLFTTTEWYTVISIAFLLFSNYYTLFKLIRDYLIAWKVYQAEFTIQYKANNTPKKILLRSI